MFKGYCTNDCDLCKKKNIGCTKNIDIFQLEVKMYKCRDCGYCSGELEAIVDVDTGECFSCGSCDIRGFDYDEYLEEKRESYLHEQADDRRKYD